MPVPTPNTGNAPVFRKVFTVNETAGTAEIFLCGLGWHELYVNGIKADDRVLAPSVSRFGIMQCFSGKNEGHFTEFLLMRRHISLHLKKAA